MKTETIELYCEEIGRKIAKLIASRYDQADLDIHPLGIEKEIYQVSLGYASVFVFEATNTFTVENIDDLKSIINSRYFIKSKKTNKMTSQELVAHFIKSEAIKTLGAYDLILI